MDVAATCMRELHALPAFLDGLEQSVAGGLSDGQRRCVEKGYLALDPEVLEAAAADALGASKGTERAVEIKSMLQDCGVKVGG